MKGSRKTVPPKAFLDWLALANDDWKPSYRIFRGEVKREVVLKLLQDQRGLCAYCGKKINIEFFGKTAHIDHFKPQSNPEYFILRACPERSSACYSS